MTLDPSAPGGMVTYRRTLTLSLFYKFYLSVLQKLRAQVSVMSLTLSVMSQQLSLRCVMSLTPCDVTLRACAWRTFPPTVRAPPSVITLRRRPAFRSSR